MKGKRVKCLGLAICCMAASLFACGCGASANDGKIEIEIVQYKPEAANYFKTVEDEFNATHDDIHLKISSPNDAMTILKTRFIREDYPDIIGIGGDINYSYFVDAEILADISAGLGISTRAIWILMKRWNWFLRKGPSRCLMWPTLPEFCITGTCLKNMDGLFPKTGKNFSLCAMPSRRKGFFRSTSDSRIRGLALHRGTPWRWICRLRIRQNR